MKQIVFILTLLAPNFRLHLSSALFLFLLVFFFFFFFFFFGGGGVVFLGGSCLFVCFLFCLTNYDIDLKEVYM